MGVGSYLKRGFRDRDYIQTIEDYFFTVIGNIHPSNRITAYLKNIPSPSGKWGNERKRYARVLKHYTMMDVVDTIDFLKLNNSDYIYRSKEQKITFSFVPLHKIKHHYKPEEKLAKLLTSEKLDRFGVVAGEGIDKAQRVMDIRVFRTLLHDLLQCFDRFVDLAGLAKPQALAVEHLRFLIHGAL